MELLSIEDFFPVFEKRLKIFFFALDTNYICEYEKVYLLLNWTGNKLHGDTVFAELTRPYTRILNQSKAQMQPDFHSLLFLEAPAAQGAEQHCIYS